MSAKKNIKAKTKMFKKGCFYVKNFKTYQAMCTNPHFKNGLEKLLWTLLEFSTRLLFFELRSSFHKSMKNDPAA